MAENPQQNAIIDYARSREDIKTIALRQRALLICIVAYLTFPFIHFVLPSEVRTLILFISAGICITASVFVFLLATKIYGNGRGILLGICTLIPIVGLIFLFVVNAKATAILRRAGIPVGLMGANTRA